jgi:hypothetical protein
VTVDQQADDIMAENTPRDKRTSFPKTICARLVRVYVFALKATCALQ